MTEVHSFYYLIKRFCFILYKKFAKILPQDTAVKKTPMLASIHPGKGCCYMAMRGVGCLLWLGVWRCLL